MAIVVTSKDGICTWSGWAGTLPAAKTLSVTSAVATDQSGGLSHNSLSYTLDGSSWANFYATTAPIPSATYTAAVPSGTNLANVAVKAASYCTVSRVSGDYADATITVSGLGIA